MCLPTVRETALDIGLLSAATVALHSTVALLTAWKFRTLVELYTFPSKTLVVLYWLLSTSPPLTTQLTVGSGCQAVMSHWNSTCCSFSTVTFPSLMLTAPLSEKYKETQEAVWHKIWTRILKYRDTNDASFFPSFHTSFPLSLHSSCLLTRVYIGLARYGTVCGYVHGRPTPLRAYHSSSSFNQR